MEAAVAAKQWKRLEEEEEQQEQQEEQAPKKRGKQKTFDNRMEDLKQYKETHGHIKFLFLRTNPSTNSAPMR